MEFINFGAGPAKIPLKVKNELKDELLNYKDTGMSVMELSHRSKDYDFINDSALDYARKLLKVPDNYKIIFTAGGGTGHFAAIPLNFIGRTGAADYIVTGTWSALAAQEAEKYGKVRMVLPKTDKYTDIPDEATWTLNPKASYVYYCANETINGIEFPFIPDSKGVPLVADMSSNFFSKPFDISKFGMVFAGAQKNVGTAGAAVAIIREDLLGSALPFCPSILDFTLIAKHNSIANTPPVFPIYVMGKVFKWISECGGLEEMERQSAAKSNLIYSIIDSSGGFYKCPISLKVRSRMNIPFTIKKSGLEETFLADAKALGMLQLKGHRSVGGLRVSLYNAITLEETQKLADFMKCFQVKHT